MSVDNGGIYGTLGVTWRPVSLSLTEKDYVLPLAGALDSVQPIEEPQTRYDSQVKDDLAEHDIPGLNLPPAVSEPAFWFRSLGCGRGGPVRSLRLIEFSGRFHGETSFVIAEDGG
jgi:hypothetical protein